MSSPRGTTHLALSYWDSAAIYGLLSSLNVVPDHCGRCARTAERLTQLLLTLEDYLSAVAVHPEYFALIRKNAPTQHVQLPINEEIELNGSITPPPPAGLGT